MVNSNGTMEDEKDKGEIGALKQIRQTLGLTQQELAVLLGVTVTTVARWERGREPHLTLSQIKELDKLLTQAGYSIQQLPETFADPFLQKQA